MDDIKDYKAEFFDLQRQKQLIHEQYVNTTNPLDARMRELVVLIEQAEKVEKAAMATPEPDATETV